LSLTLREEHRLRLFENRVLRRIFGPKREEITEDCRKLLNENLYDLHSSPNIIWLIKSRRLGWAEKYIQNSPVFWGMTLEDGTDR
jgi:hypothetical protein